MSIKVLRIYEDVPQEQINNAIDISSKENVLCPTDDILNAYKVGDINWDRYEERYIALLFKRLKERPSEFQALVDKAKTQDVIIVCSNGFYFSCHCDLAKCFLEGLPS